VYSLLLCTALLAAAAPGSKVEYVGGTVDAIRQRADGRIAATHPELLVFEAGPQKLTVAYSSINLLEYGQKADRRYLTAVLVSPVFLLSKKRTHFLTVGYQDPEGRQQAMVFRVDKGDLRPLLASLEARTGVRVQYQDAEARKAAGGSGGK
jgi:hypothetical protein